jgi:glycosyltransferase involved in cell wall biosynthesis
MPDTILVVPCYNEAARLQPDAFLAVVERDPRLRLLLVNDGSRDDTLDVLRRLAHRVPGSIEVLDLPRNGGKAEAVRQGVLAALRSEPSYVGFWDADLAAPLEQAADLRRVLDRRPEIDVVLSTRLPLLGRNVHRRPLRRRLGRLCAALASAALGLRLYDTQCGAKLFRATPETAELFARPFAARWLFDIEILARMVQTRGRQAVSTAIYELPLDEWTEVPGSRVKAGDYLRALGELAAIWWRHLRPGARPSLDEPGPRALPAFPALGAASRRAA